MLCIMCGQPIKSKAIEGSDYIKVKTDYWCKPCAIDKLSQWELFEQYEKLAEEGGRYREALISTLVWSINEGYCMKPKERCEANAEKCLRCWMEFLVGEMDG